RDDSGSNACSPAATNAFRLVDASADLTLLDLSLSGGCNLVDQGGAVRVQGAALWIERSTISANQTFVENPEGSYGTGGIGGGVAVTYGNLSLIDTTLSGNATHGNLAVGGGAAAYSSDLTVLRSTISGNHTNDAPSAGAGLYASGDFANGLSKTTM